MDHIGPNDRCNCGSGQKFKKCCGAPKGYNPPLALTDEELKERENRRASARVSLVSLAMFPLMFGY